MFFGETEVLLEYLKPFSFIQFAINLFYVVFALPLSKLNLQPTYTYVRIYMRQHNTQLQVVKRDKENALY